MERKSLKYTFILCSWIVCCNSLFSQDVSWAKQLVPFSSWNAGNHVNADDKHNLYITGLYNGSAQSGDPTGSFIQKYDSLGTLLWSEKLTGVLIYGSYIDSLGNSYITGRFGGTVIFGSTTLYGNGWEFFVAKYDSQGNCEWAKQGGQATGNTLKGDAAGNIYITGALIGTCSFGNYSLSQTIQGSNDFFIVKYDSSGNCLWVRQTAGGIYGTGGDIIVSQNSIYIIDNYITPITFGNGNNATTLITHGGSIFLAKYSTSGNFSWAKQLSDSGQCSGKGIVVDEFENIYVSGWYSKKVKFGNAFFTCSYTNAFLLKYDMNGVSKWAKQPLNASGYGNALAINHAGEIYLITSIETTGMNTIVIKYDAAGIEKWRMGYSGLSVYSSVVGYGITARDSKVYLTGEFFGNVSFGNHSLNKNFNGPDRDAFVLKIKDNEIDKMSGVSEVTDKNEIAISVYPNPTGDLFKVNCSNISECNIELNVLNSQGQKVYTEALSIDKGEFSRNIDLSKEAKGVYFIEILTKKNRTVKRVVVD